MWALPFFRWQRIIPRTHMKHQTRRRLVAIRAVVCPHSHSSLFRDFSAEVVRHIGPRVVFHLHSTGYRHYQDVLQVPGIAGLQMTIEANGPSLGELTPVSWSDPA